MLGYRRQSVVAYYHNHSNRGVYFVYIDMFYSVFMFVGFPVDVMPNRKGSYKLHRTRRGLLIKP